MYITYRFINAGAGVDTYVTVRGAPGKGGKTSARAGETPRVTPGYGYTQSVSVLLALVPVILMIPDM